MCHLALHENSECDLGSKVFVIILAAVALSEMINDTQHRVINEMTNKVLKEGF